jgi:transposase InsO family protein
MSTSGSEGGQQKPARSNAGSGAAGRPYTEQNTAEGKLYLCAINDMFADKIVVYSIADRMTAKLAVDAVRNAVTRRGEVTDYIVHAERGPQSCSRRMAAANRHDIVVSMGCVASAGGNAAMKSL